MQQIYLTSFSSVIAILWSIKKNHDAGLWSHRAQILVEAIKTDIKYLENNVRQYTVRTQLCGKVLMSQCGQLED